MTPKAFLSMVFFLCFAESKCRGASIGDGLVIEEVAAPEEILPLERAVATDAIHVVESQPVLVPEEIIRLEAEEPKMVEQLVAEQLPFELNAVHRDEFPMEVMTAEENCDKPAAIIDEKSADRAEREAEEDLLRALDTVLEKKETLGDVLRSEDVVIPVTLEQV